MAARHDWIRKSQNALIGMKNEKARWRISAKGFELGAPFWESTVQLLGPAQPLEFTLKIYRLGEFWEAVFPNVLWVTTALVQAYVAEGTIPPIMRPGNDTLVSVMLYELPVQGALSGVMEITAGGGMRFWKVNTAGYGTVPFSGVVGQQAGIIANTATWSNEVYEVPTGFVPPE